jgi:protease-4
VVELKGDYAERRPSGLVSRLLDERPSLVDVLDNLEKARHDERVRGVIVRVGTLSTGWGQAQEIRSALARLNGAGKQVVAFVEGNVFGGNQEYYLASVADRVFVPPSSSPLMNGLSAHYLFLGGVWEKADIAVEVEQIREYKTFGDMLSRKSMSAAHREMANSLLDDVNQQFVEAIAAGRSLRPDQVNALIDACPATAEKFVEAGLADGIMFFDEILEDLGGGEAVHVISEDEYAGVKKSDLGLGGGGRIAVIHASGVIVPGDEDGRGPLGSEIGSRIITDAFKHAVADERVKAIVFRIDSPGGSPDASDEVWKQVQLSRASKPVVVSMGNVAASGGYYMAAGADRIVTNPATFTGSIGVVLFKPDVSGLLERLGVGSEGLSRGRYSRIMDITKGLDADELSLIRNQMGRVYDLFLERVATGRHMTTDDVDRVGAGRVWTGQQAIERGLADELGGLREAVAAAAKAASIDDVDSVDVVYYPPPKGIAEQLLSLAKVQARAVIPGAVRESLGGLAGYLDLVPGIYTLLPAPLAVR